MTAHAMAGDEQKSLEAGMNDHVTKPIDPDQLFTALHKWIAPAAERASDHNQPAADAKAEPQPAVSENDTLPESLPGFDLTEGLRRLQGNRRLYRKLILSFAGSCREMLDTIWLADAENDLVSIRNLAHSLKGSAGNLAADEVHAAAMALERLAGKNSDETPSQENLKHCLEQLDAKVAIILTSVEKLGAGAKPVIPMAGDIFDGIPEVKREALAKRMKSAAEMGDIFEFQAIANELESEFGDKQLLSQRIIRLADNFDLDKLAQLAAKRS
jgi:HPt (histidine-containing phosphotransfer) domain-containing protein